MAEENELDLSKPGKLWAAVENESTTTFHLVLPQAGYTKEALSQNPSIHPQDDLMTPFVVPHASVAKDGVALLDLEASGRAGEIMARLADRYERGGARVDKVKGVVIVTAREGNKIPAKQLAEVKEWTLVPIPLIKLRGLKTYLTVKNWKDGSKEFQVELSVMGPLKEVELSTTPGCDVKSSGGQSGKGTIKVPVEEGKKYTVSVAAPFVMRSEQKQQMVERTYIHYGRATSWADYGQGGLFYKTYNGQSHQRYMPQSYTREIWDGAQVTLRATGTGSFAGIRQSVVLTAESWAASWLAGPPPPPFFHNCC